MVGRLSVHLAPCHLHLYTYPHIYTDAQAQTRINLVSARTTTWAKTSASSLPLSTRKTLSSSKEVPSATNALQRILPSASSGHQTQLCKKNQQVWRASASMLSMQDFSWRVLQPSLKGEGVSLHVSARLSSLDVKSKLLTLQQSPQSHFHLLTHSGTIDIERLIKQQIWSSRQLKLCLGQN
jgi:hypothetical protein